MQAASSCLGKANAKAKGLRIQHHHSSRSVIPRETPPAKKRHCCFTPSTSVTLASSTRQDADSALGIPAVCDHGAAKGLGEQPGNPPSPLHHPVGRAGSPGKFPQQRGKITSCPAPSRRGGMSKCPAPFLSKGRGAGHASCSA